MNLIFNNIKKKYHKIFISFENKKLQKNDGKIKNEKYFREMLSLYFFFETRQENICAMILVKK